MKKCISLLTVLLLLWCLGSPLGAYAVTGSASLTGPGTVRAGDTITLTFRLSGENLYGASGTLRYDSAQLTKLGTKQTVGSPWVVEFYENNMVAYDNNLSSPIQSGTNLFTVSFQVKDLAPGTEITVSYTNVMASDGTADANIGTVSYHATVAQPLSGNNDLSALKVSNAALSPSFRPETTSYTAEVPYSVSKLDLQATAADPKAKVSVKNPSLTADGNTTVTVTVTAENGSEKKYTIRVHRARDPNYVPSGENQLSELTVEGFLLSPVFRREVTEYLVWLPYETESVQVRATAADAKAKVTVTGGETLLPGQDNPIQVVCTAENGETRTYTVIAKRAAAHGAETEPTEAPTEAPTVPPTTAPPETTVPETTAPAVTLPFPEETGREQMPRWVPLILCLLCLVLGLAAGYLLGRRHD